VTWLIDKSAYQRLGQSPDATTWIDRIERGLVHISTVTRLEIGYSMRSADALTAELDDVLGRLVSVYSPPRAEDRAIEVQTILTERGHHRAPSIPDLLVAATAEATGHVVLHLDKDFELIADITGQPVERIALPIAN
jgi:predicted nucleic acid-binding protein